MRNLTASDRSALIKLASSLPSGSSERRDILASLGKVAGNSGVFTLSVRRERNTTYASVIFTTDSLFWGPELKYALKNLKEDSVRLLAKKVELMKALKDEANARNGAFPVIQNEKDTDRFYVRDEVKLSATITIIGYADEVESIIEEVASKMNLPIKPVA
jgi:hypothetical protein